MTWCLDGGMDRVKGGLALPPWEECDGLEICQGEDQIPKPDLISSPWKVLLLFLWATPP